MDPVRFLREGLADDSLRTAILVGLATVPFTVVLSWEPAAGDTAVVGGSVSGTPMLLAGLVVGSLYRNRGARRAGIWTGLAASVGTAILFVANTVTTVPPDSPEWIALAVVLEPVVVGLGVALTVAFTAIPALIGGWAATRLQRDRRIRVTGSEKAGATGRSRWWLAVLGYALVAPVVLVYVLWIQPESGVGFALSIVGVFGLVVSAVIAFVGLFVDVTAPRDPATDRLPSAWLYVGVPIGAAVLVSALATLRTTGNPAGDGAYGFVIALWVTATAYLVFERRPGRTVSSGTNA